MKKKNTSLLKTIAVCSTLQEAMIIHSALTAYGFHAFIADGHTDCVYGGVMTNALGGIRIHVPLSEANQALEFLQICQEQKE